MAILPRRNVPRLLSTVKGAAYARQSDHEDALPQQKLSPQVQSKSPSPPLPKHESDVDREPESSRDENNNLGNIPSSFDKNKQTIDPVGSRAPANSHLKRSISQLGTEVAANGKPAKKLRVPPTLKEIEKDSADSWVSERKAKVFKPGFGASAVSMKKQQAEFKKRSVVEMKPDARPKKAFKSIDPSKYPSPASSGTRRADLSDGSDPLAGCEDYLSSGERDTERLDLPSHGSKSKRPGKSKVKDKKKASNKEAKEFRHASSLTSSPRSSAPEFKRPQTSTQAARHFTADDLEREARDQEAEEEAQWREQNAARASDEGPCPMRCGKIMSWQDLESLGLNPTIKEQQAFCKAHQMKDAKREWSLRGYPKIDWNELPSRLRQHHSSIEAMLHHPTRLTYRKEMESRLKHGQDRTLMQHMKTSGLDSIGAGYYGPRGGDLFAAHILRHFAAVIRARAGDDRIIAARGPAGYVQMVLALELALVLVREDMGVDEEVGREIMAESTGMGNLLWPSGEGERGKGKESRNRDLIVEDGSTQVV